MNDEKNSNKFHHIGNTSSCGYKAKLIVWPAVFLENDAVLLYYASCGFKVPPFHGGMDGKAA
jgi:hypothetical protein